MPNDRLSEEELQRRFERRMNLGCVAVALLFIGGLVALRQYAATLPQKPDKPESIEFAGRERRAGIESQDYVKRHLLAPSTADFPWYADKVTHIGNGRYRVYGHFDAQNRFGAMIRSRYTCVMTYHRDGTWTGSALEIE